MFLLNLFVFILVLGVIILIHEFGHFYFAKRADILCHEFSIGMGPAIYQKRKGETVYSIRSIPIGGYVSMAGESVADSLIKKGMLIGVKINDQNQITHIVMDSSLPYDKMGKVKSFDLYGKNYDQLYIELESEQEIIKLNVLRDAIYQLSPKRQMWITPAEKSFETKTLWQRFSVIFAGPFMNFVLAIFLFIIISFFVMKPNVDSSEVSMISQTSPAETIGLLKGDVITSINGENVSSWFDISRIMSQLTSVTANITFLRDEETHSVENIQLMTYIQTAGLSNVLVENDELKNIFHDEAIIGQVFGRAIRADFGQPSGLLSWFGEREERKQFAPGDLITKIEINSMTYPINNWDDVVQAFRANPEGGLLTLHVERQGETFAGSYQLISQNALSRLDHQAFVFQLGISPTEFFDFSYTLQYPFKAFYQNSSQVLKTIGLLFDPNEQLGLGDLAGPVGIFSLVSSTTRQGFLAILSFTAFLSINIGLLNLMPIPALDGGRLVFLGVEAITKRPLNRKLENSLNNLMFFLLLFLLIYVTYNDILRFILG
jgi:regulator of sigma E protease